MGAMAKRIGCARRSACRLGAGLIGLLSSGCLDRPLALTEPETRNVVVKQLAQEAPSKLDVLFMIDNSQSMSDKQALLADAVPALVRRLVAPRCVDPVTGAVSGGNYPCQSGEPEFRPVRDIHVGVLSSSLGGHGADYCTPKGKNWSPTQDDGAHLLGERRALGGATAHLDWSPGTDAADPSSFIQNFAEQVKAAGDDGCGYEASLEAWYRFLIDPDPPAAIVNQNGVTVAEGIDEVLLTQRRDFLRPDSLLLVVMLSDENDCSIVDSGQSSYIAQEAHLYRATAACDGDPESVCCRSCGSDESAPPTGCPSLLEDPGCQTPQHDDVTDDVNLRCWQQKRRFGVDFLHPVQRYIEGLTQLTVRNRAGQLVPNPLFSDLTGTGARPRSPANVLLAGILGVPWHDLADEQSLSDPNSIRYLSARELTEKDRWSWLLPSAAGPPVDPLMRESVLPRQGTQPATLVPLVLPDGPGVHPVNGHEWNTGNRDLQYACIYPLAKPRDCTTATADCACKDVAPGDPSKNPLCQDPETGTYGTTQHFAKAYPGTRQLEVLKGVGENSIALSICPKLSSGETSSPSFGYNPAVDSIVERLRDKLLTQCMPRPLSLAADGSAQCAVVEALPASACSCDATKNRRLVSDKLAKAARRELRASAQCGPNSPGQLACEAFCLCEIGAATDMKSCQNDPKPSGTGWCYVEAARGIGNPALVASCPETSRQLVRFAGDETPAPGANVLVGCVGAALGQ